MKRRDFFGSLVAVAAAPVLERAMCLGGEIPDSVADAPSKSKMYLDGGGDTFISEDAPAWFTIRVGGRSYRVPGYHA